MLNPDVTYGYPPEIWPLDPGPTPQNRKPKDVLSQKLYYQRKDNVWHMHCHSMVSFMRYNCPNLAWSNAERLGSDQPLPGCVRGLLVSTKPQGRDVLLRLHDHSSEGYSQVGQLWVAVVKAGLKNMISSTLFFSVWFFKSLKGNFCLSRKSKKWIKVPLSMEMWQNERLLHVCI